MRGAQARQTRAVLLPVPADIALAYDGKGWRLIAAPPTWWTAEREQELRADASESAMPEPRPTEYQTPEFADIGVGNLSASATGTHSPRGGAGKEAVLVMPVRAG